MYITENIERVRREIENLNRIIRVKSGRRCEVLAAEMDGGERIQLTSELFRPDEAVIERFVDVFFAGMREILVTRFGVCAINLNNVTNFNRLHESNGYLSGKSYCGMKEREARKFICAEFKDGTCQVTDFGRNKEVEQENKWIEDWRAAVQKKQENKSNAK